MILVLVACSLGLLMTVMWVARKVFQKAAQCEHDQSWWRLLQYQHSDLQLAKNLALQPFRTHSALNPRRLPNPFDVPVRLPDLDIHHPAGALTT